MLVKPFMYMYLPFEVKYFVKILLFNNLHMA